MDSTTYQESIAVNEQGEAVIGCNRFGPQTTDGNADGKPDGRISCMALRLVGPHFGGHARPERPRKFYAIGAYEAPWAAFTPGGVENSIGQPCITALALVSELGRGVPSMVRLGFIGWMEHRRRVGARSSWARERATARACRFGCKRMRTRRSISIRRRSTIGSRTRGPDRSARRIRRSEEAMEVAQIRLREDHPAGAGSSGVSERA